MTHRGPLSRPALAACAALVAGVLLAPSPTRAEVASSPSFVLAQDAVASAAGTTLLSDSYVLDATLSQPATVGETTSDSWVVESGFWTSLSTRRVIRVDGAGSGSGLADGEGIACLLDAGATAGDCSQSFVDGETIFIVADPDAANAFDFWAGCTSVLTTDRPGDTCEVTVGSGRTVTARFTALGTVTGRVWRDVDGAGDQDPSEPGFGGIGVTLTNGDDVTVSTTTAADGTYSFVDVYPGEYDVVVDTGTLPPGVVPSYDPDGLLTPNVTDFVLSDGEALAAVDFGYQPQTNLEILKVDDVDPLPGGEPLTYTITVTNQGPGIATEVEVFDQIPIGTTLVRTEGCAEDPVAMPTCTLGVLDVGESASYTLEVSIDPAPPASITNTASVTALEVDLDTADNADDESTELDAVPPSVSFVDTVPSTEDGVLTFCETVNGQRVDQLEIAFDEAMRNPDGDSEPGDVTNPASYRLFGAGADAELDTASCGPPAGDDVAVAITAVVYDASSRVATLEPASSLAPGLYRLVACAEGEAALTDLGGTPLDGDGDGTAGEDFTLRFRADPDNALENGHFDCDLGGWTVEATSGAIERSELDYEQSADSGSVRVDTELGGTDFAVSQCAPLRADLDRFELGAWLRVDVDGESGSVGLELSCTFYGAAGCAGAASPPFAATGLVEDTDGEWIGQYVPITRPANSASARCRAELTAIESAEFTGYLDRLELTPLASPLFTDGFESGDTSAWSAATP